MAMSVGLLMALLMLWESTSMTEAQVYAYEEDYDRGYPGAGPYGYYHNICNFECPDVWSPVCATDGYSYPSGCHLFVASCWKQILGQKGTRFWYRGTCLLEGSTDYDPQPGLKKREEEERQKKIDAGEWVPTTPPADAIYINGQPYLPPYQPAPTSAPAGPPTDPVVAVAEEEEVEVEEEEEERVEDTADEPIGTGLETESSFAPDETPIESRRRRRRRSLLHLLNQSSPRRQQRSRRRHRRNRHHRRYQHRHEDDCQWSCPLTPEPICGSDGKTHFNKCHFLRHRCRLDAAKKPADAESTATAAAAAAVAASDVTIEATADEEAIASEEVVDASSNKGFEKASEGVPANIAVKRAHQHPEGNELVIRHAGRCGRFVDAADGRVRECVAQCGLRRGDDVIQPVCASNGKTYPNFCFYQQAKCLAYLNEEVDINFFKIGFCQ